MKNSFGSFLERVLLICLISLSTNLSAQLREFTASTMQTPETPVVQANAKYPNNALMLIYSDLEGLQFRSSVGAINQQSYNATAGRYEILCSPLKQMIFVAKAGFMEIRVATINPLPKAVLYFQVEERMTAASGGRGTLEIISEPEDCRILLNDLELLDRTPFVREIPAGPNRISLRKNRYIGLDTIINLPVDEKYRLQLSLAPNWADVSVNAQPAESKITMNGQLRGTGVWRATGASGGLEPGSYHLQISLDKHYPHEEVLELKPGNERQFNVVLKPITGILDINSEPPGAEVLIGGDRVGYTPHQEELLIGSYEVTVKKRGHLEEQKTVRITENKSHEESIKLRNYRKALTPPKVGKWSMLALGLAGAGTGGYFLYTSINDYERYQTATDNAAELREQVRTARTIYPIAFAAGGAALIGSLIFNGKVQKKKRNWGLAAAPVENGAVVGWTCVF